MIVRSLSVPLAISAEIIGTDLPKGEWEAKIKGDLVVACDFRTVSFSCVLCFGPHFLARDHRPNTYGTMSEADTLESFSSAKFTALALSVPEDAVAARVFESFLTRSLFRVPKLQDWDST